MSETKLLNAEEVIKELYYRAEHVTKHRFGQGVSQTALGMISLIHSGKFEASEQDLLKAGYVRKDEFTCWDCGNVVTPSEVDAGQCFCLKCWASRGNAALAKEVWWEARIQELIKDIDNLDSIFREWCHVLDFTPGDIHDSLIKLQLKLNEMLVSDAKQVKDCESRLPQSKQGDSSRPSVSDGVATQSEPTGSISKSESVAKSETNKKKEVGGDQANGKNKSKRTPKKSERIEKKSESQRPHEKKINWKDNSFDLFE